MLSCFCRPAPLTCTYCARPAASPIAIALRLLCAGALSAGCGGYAQAQTEPRETAESFDRAAEAEVLERSTDLPTVEVRSQIEFGELPPARAGGQIGRGVRAGVLGNKDVMETPFSVSSYTAQLMRDQQAVTLADTLRKDSSVRYAGQPGGVTEPLVVRGFPVAAGNVGEVAMDGVFGVAPNYHLFTEYLERIELVKGPSAVLYGMAPSGGIGGVVNVVPKRPLGRAKTEFTLNYGSAAHPGAHVDVSRRFGASKQFGVRFNGAHRQGATMLDRQDQQVDLGAVSLDYLGDRWRASVDLIAQQVSGDAPSRPYDVAAGVAVPVAPNGRRNVVQPWSWWRSTDKSVLLHTEYDLSERFTWFADAGGTASNVARLSDQRPQILNAAGDTLSQPGAYRFLIDRQTADTGVRARFDTGPVKHAMSLQASVYRDRTAWSYQLGMNNMRSNIYHPGSSPLQSLRAPDRVPKVSSSQLTGVALADTLSVFDERVQLTVGLRQQRIFAKNFNTDTGAVKSIYDESAVSPLVGVVFRPWQHISLYANYIEGLSKGDIAPYNTANAGNVLAPYKAKQHEVGIKFDCQGLLTTFSTFQIAKPSGAIVNDIFAVNGLQQNRGVELNFFGEPARGLRLLAGVTLLDAKLTGTASSALLGNRPIGVAKVLANAGAEWDVRQLPGLTLSGGVTYTGRQFVDQANTQSLPAWTTVDLGARYRTRVAGKTTTFRAGVVNLFDRGYWSGVGALGTISLGAPRTAMLSTTMDF